MSKNFPHDNIYSILGKLDALKPTPAEERFALVKEIRESVEAQGSVLEGVSAVEAKLAKAFAESQVNEKSVGQAQQKFMGMVHAAQKGSKAASPEVAKVAKSMGKKDAKDFASTKHAGLPKHVAEKYDPVKAVKQCAKNAMEMNGIASVHDLDAEDIEYIGDECQMNYHDVCEILGIQLPDSLGPVQSWDTDEQGNKFDLEEGTCNECGMFESECSCEHTNEGIVDNIKFAFGKTIAWVVDTAAKFANTPELKGKMNQAKVDIANKAEQQMLKAIAGHPREDQLKQQVNYIVTQLKQQPTMGDLLNVAKQLGAEFKTERSKFEEGEITRKPGVTKHTKTDYPGYPTDDADDIDDENKGKRGRPRKAQTKNPRKDPNAPKKTVGRPSKEKPAVYAKHADPFGRVIGAVPTSKLPSRTHTMESVVQYVAESVNFKRMMEEQHMTLSEMLECMNADMQQFQETGVCSDRLRDMMEVYSHAKRQMEEEATKTVPPAAPARGIPGNVPVPGKMERLGGGRDYYEEDSDMLEAELSELARLAGITDEGNAFSGAVAKAKADGIQPGEKISVGGKEYPVKEADATVDDNEEELANTPHPKYGSIKAITTQGDDLNRQKRQDPHTANKAANPLTNVPTLEAKLAAEYESIKKVS